jgi:DNA-binding transcriptional ArsR family regulator
MSAHAYSCDVFQAIADPTRRKVLRLLAKREMPIVTIAEHFPISRTAVNKHLHVLSDAGLVSKTKVGRETRYKLCPEPLLEVKDWLAHYEQFWDNKLAALRNYVEGNRMEEGDSGVCTGPYKDGPRRS